MAAKLPKKQQNGWKPRERPDGSGAPHGHPRLYCRSLQLSNGPSRVRWVRLLLSTIALVISGLLFSGWEEGGKCQPAIQAKNTRTAFFDADPHHFVEQFAECVLDTRCRFYYNHIQKTGGSYISSLLYPMLMGGERYNSSFWCCGKNSINRFRNDSSYYCSDSMKVTIWEKIKALQLEEVISVCKQQHPSMRALVLTSIREPIQRTLSLINQKCVKEYRKRDPDFQSACDRCSYKKDPEFWDAHFLEDTNQAYVEADAIHKLNLEYVQVMTIDTPSVSNFFAMLQERLPNWTIPKGSKHPSKKLGCDLGINADMARGLVLSEMIYKNLTLDLP